ncbi:MAG: hypothetical protein JNN26_26465 [Candidatus Obscuribacter sp.]|nr:hypothetical protein [Candidatus Obscuribacter sp.]
MINREPSRPELEKIERDYLNTYKFDRCTEGLKQLQEILKRDKNDGYVHFLIGLAYHRRAYALGSRYKTKFQTKPEWEKALQSYNQAFDCGFRTAQLYYHRGETKLNLGRPAEAVLDLDKSIEMEPGRDWVWSTRGMAYEDLGERRKARSDIMKAIEINPSRSTNYEKLAGLNVALGALPAARRAMDKAVAIQPEVPDYRVFRALIASDMGDRKTCEEDLAVALAKDPTNALALKLRGKLNLRQDQPEQALADMVSADEINRDLAGGAKTMLTAEAARSALSKALAQYKNMRNVQTPQYLYEIGCLEWGLALWPECCGHLEVLLPQSQTGELSGVQLHSIALTSLALLSRGQGREANELLTRLKTGKAARGVVAGIVSYFCGRKSLEELDRVATSQQDKSLVNFYVGAWLARHDQEKAAKERLNWVVEKGDRKLDQYMLAVMELARLKASKGVNH